MQFSENISIQLIIVVLGIFGFLVSKHIRSHKTKNTPLVCPVRFDCHAVVHSDYSKFLGIPVELSGMIYYSMISLAYLFIILTQGSAHILFVNLVIVSSLLAFVFSLYLISIQIFILKKGCSWCIVSSLISASIFILTVVMYHLGYILGLFLK